MSSERLRGSLGRALLALLALGLASCALFVPPEMLASGGPARHALAFDHDVHVTTAHLECATCHETAKTGATAGLPKLSVCMDCHEDEEKPSTRAFLAGIAARPEAARWVTYSPTPDLIYSHAAHVGRGTACATCHGAVATAPATGPWVRPSMDACVACHRTERTASTSCATCHEATRKELPPASHLANWRVAHGRQVRMGDVDPLLRGRCEACHEPDACLACHKQVPPTSHTQLFVARGHGLEAASDRRACARCHTQESCSRCHQSTAPGSHHGGWGAPTDRHCVSCHVGSSAQDGCAACHDRTPSHDRATPRPAGHTADLNCRQCHGLAQPLPHADNGMECIACHR